MSVTELLSFLSSHQNTQLAASSQDNRNDNDSSSSSSSSNDEAPQQREDLTGLDGMTTVDELVNAYQMLKVTLESLKDSHAQLTKDYEALSRETGRNRAQSSCVSHVSHVTEPSIEQIKTALWQSVNNPTAMYEFYNMCLAHGQPQMGSDFIRAWAFNARINQGSCSCLNHRQLLKQELARCRGDNRATHCTWYTIFIEILSSMGS